MSIDVIKIMCEKSAPDGADWVTVRRVSDDAFGFSGSVMSSEPEAGTMLTIHCPDRCPSRALALASAVAWAASKGSGKLYVVSRREDLRQLASCA